MERCSLSRTAWSRRRRGDDLPEAPPAGPAEEPPPPPPPPDAAPAARPRPGACPARTRCAGRSPGRSRASSTSSAPSGTCRSTCRPRSSPWSWGCCSTSRASSSRGDRSAISLVLVAEMMNTAVEAAIDAVVTTYHPLVKIAKDVAAGAVLVATVNALAIGLLGLLRPPHRRRRRPAGRACALADPHRGGGDDRDRHRRDRDQGRHRSRNAAARRACPPGHAAAAFAAWAAITIVAEPLRHAALVSTLAFLMALLVAQSRVEAGIHSLVEVAAGAVLGTGIAIVMFQIWG